MSSVRGAGGFRGRDRGNKFNAQSTTPPKGPSSTRGKAFSHAPNRANNRGRGAFSSGSRDMGGFSGRGRGGFPTVRNHAAGGGAISSGTWQERQEQLQKYRDQERKQAIAQGLMSDPDKQIGLSEAITIVGTCQDMCPENERVLRTVRNEVWAEEKDSVQVASGLGEAEPDEARMVKAFRRSAAGDEVQLPSDLRPPAVLKRTCDYLFSEVIGNAPALEKVHHFVWDRTRAIRNDFSIQQLTKLDDLRIAIDCYERIARFHIVSLHELAGPRKPYGKYDPQQEREQLDRTLLSLMQYYEDTRGRLDLQHEAEFRAYCVILQLRDPTPDLEDRIQSWPASIANDYRVRTAVEVYTAACSTIWPEGPIDKTQHVIARQDWEKFWKLIESRKVSYLLACVAETHFMMIREMALNAIVRSAKVPKRTDGVTEANTEWLVDEMDRLFYFDTDEDLENFCARWNLHFQVREEDGKEYLDLRHLAGKPLPKGDAAKSNQVKSVLVEDKRHGRTLPAVIDGFSVRQARDAGLIVEEEEVEVTDQDAAGGEDNDAAMEEEDEDENSLFIPETKRIEQPAVKLTDDSDAAEKPSFAGLGQTNSPFGQPTAPSPFASASPFGRPSQPFGSKPAETSHNDSNAEKKSPFSFLSGAPKADESAKPATSSPFAPSKPSIFNPTSTASTPGTLGSALGAESTKPASSPFGQPVTAISTPANLFAPKSSPTDTTPIATPPSTASEKVTASAPLFSFPSLTPKPEETQTTDKPSFQFGSTNGAPAAPSLSAQPETNLKPPPQASQPPPQAQPHSPPNSQAATHTAQNATISNSGSQSPPRRPSASSWEAHKTKKPSPLSNSFTAGEDSAAQSKQAQAKEPVNELFPDRQSAKSPLPQTKPATTQTSEAENQLHKLAEHLTFDQDNGFLKQFLDFTVKQVILQAQEKVFDEKCKIKCQALEERRLIKEYGIWWRAFARHRRLAAKSRQRRERTRERLRKSTAGSSLDGFSDTDTISTQRDSIPSAVHYQRSRKDVVDALFKSVAGNMQASAGSKRTASPNGQDMTVHKDAVHKRQKSLSHTSNSGRVSRGTSVTHADADMSKRSSFLGYSATGDITNQASTTKTTYFRMKALGLGPQAGRSMTSEPRGTKRQRSESFDLDKIRSSRRSTPSTDPASTQQQQHDASAMPPPPTKPKQNDEDEALFARLRKAREALLEGESLMKDELRRSMSASVSSNESPSMERARAEARLRHSELEGSTSARSVPAYQFRESRFVPREEYGLARERALERRASRSRDNSRSVSRADERAADSPSAAKSNMASKHQGFEPPSEDVNAIDVASQPKVNGYAHTRQPSVATPAKPFSGFGANSGPSAHTAATANPFLSQATSNGVLSQSPSKPFSGLGIQQSPSQASSRSPFSPSSSFAPPPPAGSNPFLQATTTNSLGMAFARPANIENDRTVQPSQINQSLAHTFGRTNVPSADGNRQPPQLGSYMPSQVASEAVTLLSDNEDGGFDEEVSYNQRQYFGNDMLNRGGAQSGTQSFDDDDTDTAGLLQGAYHYTNSFAALADPSGEDEDEQTDGNNWGTDDQTGGFASVQGDSYQYSDEDVEESDEDDELEDDDEGPNGYLDEEGEEYGDDEDEGDFDEEEGDYDEDEDEPSTQYAPRVPRPAAAGIFRAPTQNPELQAVGNTAEEAIELSD